MRVLLPLILLGVALTSKSGNELAPGTVKMTPPWVDFREKDLHFKHISDLKKVLKDVRSLTRAVRGFAQDGLSKIRALTDTVQGFREELSAPAQTPSALDNALEKVLKNAEAEVQKAHRLL